MTEYVAYVRSNSRAGEGLPSKPVRFTTGMEGMHSVCVCVCVCVCARSHVCVCVCACMCMSTYVYCVLVCMCVCALSSGACVFMVF